MWCRSARLPSRRGFSGLLASLGTAATLAAQQMPDRSFRPMIEDRAYATGSGPVVCVDESLNNSQTLSDGFWPFSDLIRRDGYVVRVLTTAFGPTSHDDCRMLVIVAPRSRVNTDGMNRWVAGGRSLLVIADREALSRQSPISRRRLTCTSLMRWRGPVDSGRQTRRCAPTPSCGDGTRKSLRRASRHLPVWRCECRALRSRCSSPLMVRCWEP